MDASEIVKRALKRGFDEAVANTYIYKRIYLKIANSKVDSIVEKSEVTGRLFVSKDKRVVFSSIDKLSDAQVAAAIRQSEKSANAVNAKDDYNGIAKGPFKYSGNVGYSKKMLNYSKEEMVSLANMIIDNASQKGIEGIAGMLVVGSVSHNLATSGGVDNKEINTSFRLSLRLSSKHSSIQDFLVGKEIKENEVKKFVKEQASALTATDKVGKIKGGKYDILYAPSPAGSLLSNVNSMACIGSIETGSFLAGKLGKEIADKRLTIYDDGKLQQGANSSLFDDEGYPTQRTPIIASGILKNYLHNYSTAVKYGTRSTGNAGLVMPSPNMLVLEHKNKKKMDKLIEEIDKGIIITNTWYTRFSNYLSGDFSTVPRDLAIYVENGEQKFIIKQIGEGTTTGIRISDNMVRMLGSIDASSSVARQSTSWDTEGYYYMMPSIIVRNVVVTVAI